MSMRFPRQKYCRGLTLPTPGDLPDPRIEPMALVSPALAHRFFGGEEARPLFGCVWQSWKEGRIGSSGGDSQMSPRQTLGIWAGMVGTNRQPFSKQFPVLQPTSLTDF